MEKFKSIEEIRLIPEYIGEAGLEKELKVDPEVMTRIFANEDLQVTEPFYLRYEVVRIKDLLRVYGDIKGEIHTHCARCLSAMTYAVDLHLKSDYMPAPPEMTDDVEAERQSEETGFYRKEIKLGEYIVSELVLSLPIIYICSPDCKGLCPNCGVNLNPGPCKCTPVADARLKGLSELKNKLRK